MYKYTINFCLFYHLQKYTVPDKLCTQSKDAQNEVLSVSKTFKERTTEQKSCFNCGNTHQKDVGFGEETDFPENVYICNIDNHYIGYPEDAQQEVCPKWL